jgi:hypothetical protein
LQEQYLEARYIVEECNVLICDMFSAMSCGSFTLALDGRVPETAAGNGLVSIDVRVAER